MDGAADDASAHLTKKQLSLRRKVEKQRLRREEERQRLADLQRVVTQLGMVRDTLISARPIYAALPWHDVAAALGEDLTMARHENHQLKRQRQNLLDVIAGMKLWVAKAEGISRAPLQSDSAANNLGMKCISLTANAACRLHGMDWLTLILYHNTDAMLQKYRFWSDWSSVVRADAFVDVSNVDDIQHVWRFQVDIPVSMATALPFVREHVVNHLNSVDISNANVFHIDPELVQQVSNNMTYIRRMYQRPKGVDCSNIMYREFSEDGRTVFVGQNVDDDKFGYPHQLKKSMAWVIVTALASNMTRVSILSLTSSYFTLHSGPVDVTDQAKLFGLPVHDTIEPETYAHLISTKSMQGVIHAWTVYLNNVSQASLASVDRSST